MSGPKENDWLEDILRQEEPYINDNGFTARVLATLPKGKRRDWLRTAVIAGMSALGFVVGLILLPGAHFVMHSVVELSRATTLTSLPLIPALTVVGIFWAVFAFAASES